MPRFIMLCGPSASGKSTFRANLVKQNPEAVVISSDDILTDWAEADNMTYQEAFLAYRANTDTLMEDIANAAFDAEREVIWDQTHLTHAQRRLRLEMVPDTYDKVAVGFEAPTDFLLNRSHIRAVQTGKEVPDEVIMAQNEAFELPDFDDGFDDIVIISEPGHTVRTL